MNYSEAFDKYAATYWTDSEGTHWFISGVGRDQLTGAGGTLHFDIHPVDDNGKPVYSVHHCRTLEYVRKLRPWHKPVKNDAPESVTE
ncbi:hypothetical protein FDX19_01825 [Citrobacter sp. wls619]|uniref:hypothetical protein n=1 Tax=Citrobacter sp. wls619 TaxID=2576432 RepID=UPI0010CA1266|nr:hypothetical protein [Citrobacter sp. wls619]TKV13928.1 hypothetical protein FDX19_01825 [Citrobacter sp. wls619]